jgi:outer membrane protein TolC
VSSLDVVTGDVARLDGEWGGRPYREQQRSTALTDLGLPFGMVRPLYFIVVALVVATTTSAAFGQELTLADVVRLALTRNERSAIANETVVSADAAVTKARVAFLPTVTLAGSEVLRPYQVEQHGTVAARTNAASGSLTVVQPLLAVNAFPLYSGAKHSLDSARWDELDQRRKLAFDAARAFFALITQERLMSAAQSRLDRANASLADTAARAQAGLVSSNDVTRSQVDRASAEQSVANAVSGLTEARLDLGYVLDSLVPNDVDAPSEDLAPFALDIADLVRRAINQRPDLAALRSSTAAAEAVAKEPGLRFVPTINAAAQARTQDQPLFGTQNQYLDGTLTLNLNWAIWDAGNRAADADSRGAAARVAGLQERALFRQVDVDVRTAVAELVSARQALAAAQEGLEASKRDVDETNVLYKQGLAKAIELVDSNGSRFDADVALAAAELQVRQAELDLRAALGLFPIDGVK